MTDRGGTDGQGWLAPEQKIARWAAAVRLAQSAADLAGLCRSFPFDDAREVWQRSGKAAAPRDLTRLLAQAYERLELREAEAELGLLRPFLASLVDSAQDAYSYETYLVLELVVGDLTSPATPRATLARSRRRVTHLVLDLIAFEILALESAAAHASGRPTAGEVVRRLRALAAAALDFGASGSSVPAAELAQLLERTNGAAGGCHSLVEVRRSCECWLSERAEADRLRVQFSLLPMSVSHDERMFIRILQAFEALFSPLVHALGEVRAAVARAAPAESLPAARLLAPTLHSGAPLFRVLATMTPARFLAFRELTAGASAIQSRQYKLVEALCSRALDELVAELQPGQAREQLVSDLLAFDREFRSWKRAHCRIAERMIADLPGTGGTTGVSYLRERMDGPLFPRLAALDRMTALDPAALSGLGSSS
jgi:tryptophan 2,3-dioxygenase